MPRSKKSDLVKAAMPVFGAIALDERRAVVIAANKKASAEWEHYFGNISAWREDLEGKLTDACDACKLAEAELFAAEHSTSGTTLSRVNARDAALAKRAVGRRAVEKLEGFISWAEKAELAAEEVAQAQSRVDHVQALIKLSGSPSHDQLDRLALAEGLVLAATKKYETACSIAGLQRPTYSDPLKVKAEALKSKFTAEDFEKLREPKHFKDLVFHTKYSNLLRNLTEDGIRGLLEEVIEAAKLKDGKLKRTEK